MDDLHCLLIEFIKGELPLAFDPQGSAVGIHKIEARNRKIAHAYIENTTLHVYFHTIRQDRAYSLGHPQSVQRFISDLKDGLEFLDKPKQ